MPTAPRDRFDDVPDDLARVGAHRASPRRGAGWIGLAWAALATVALVASGLVALSLLDPDFELVLPTPGGSIAPGYTPPPTAEPVTDPASADPALELSISVLNGTTTAGLADAAAEQLTAAGWPEPTLANASASDVTTTIVYYWTVDYEGVARGIAAQLGVGTVTLSDAFGGSPITIVLGADYAAPAN